MKRLFEGVEVNRTKWIVSLLGVAAIMAVACAQAVGEESPRQMPDVSSRDAAPAVVTDDPPVGTEPLTNQPPMISLDLIDPHRCVSVHAISACFSEGFDARDLNAEHVKAVCARVDEWLAGANKSECRLALEALQIEAETHTDEATASSAYRLEGKADWESMS